MSDERDQMDDEGQDSIKYPSPSPARLPLTGMLPQSLHLSMPAHALFQPKERRRSDERGWRWIGADEGRAERSDE